MGVRLARHAMATRPGGTGDPAKAPESVQDRIALKLYRARGTAPFPDIDWKALFDEVWPLLRPEGRQSLQAPRTLVNAMRSVDLSGAGEAEGSLPAVSDEELELARQGVLAKSAHGVVAKEGADALLRTGAGPVDRTPNPRLVSPEDLADSPSLARLGRLMQRASPPAGR